MSTYKNEIPITEHNGDIEFYKIPISALRQKCRQILSQRLNQTKVIPTENGLPRDWRGIADLANIRSVYGQAIQIHVDQMEKLLEIWCTKNYKQTASVDNLIKFLVEIDRWDVLNDINDVIVVDAKFYKDKIKNEKAISKTSEDLNASDRNILTVDDVYNSKQNLPPQLYDAFVLFDEADENFAEELINRMEDQGFKLCVKERDLIGGVSFEHESVIRLISERCNRLIVIFSPEFLKSPTNEYLLNYACSFGIEKRKRKILPCIYKYCELPSTLSYIWRLDFTRSSKFFNFWEKLKDSIQQTSSREVLLSNYNSINCVKKDKSFTNKNIQEIKKNKVEFNLTDVSNIKDDFNVNNSVNTNLEKNQTTYDNKEEFSVNRDYIQSINETNVTSAITSKTKVSSKKWMNFKKWLPLKIRRSSNCNSVKEPKKDMSKRKFKKHKLVYA